VAYSNSAMLKIARTIRVPISFLFGAGAIITAFHWNPDPHNDGYMFTGAIAFNDNYMPNSGYFAQYGPLSSVVQGLGLNIYGQNLIGLRLFSATLVIASGAIFCHRIFQRFGSVVASLAWLCWALSGPMGMPWSTIITTNLIVIALSISFKFDGKKFLLRPNFLILAIQILIFATLARIHIWLILLCLGTIIVFNKSNLPKFFIRKLFWVSAANLLIMIITLNTLGVLRPYIEQSVLWSFSKYASPPLSNITGTIWAIPVLFFYLLIFLWLRFGFSRGKILQSITLITTLLLFCLIFKLALSVNTSVAFFSTRNRAILLQRSLYDPAFLLEEFCRKLLYGWDYLVTFSIIFIFIYYFLQRKINKRNLHFESFIPISFGLGTLTQLYPMNDPTHQWMITPIIVLVLVIIWPEELNTRINFKATYAIFSILIIFLASEFFVENHEQRYHYRSEILKGMTGDRLDSIGVDETLIALQNFPTDKNKIEFQCRDGLYASANRHFMSYSYMYVDWGLETSSKNASAKYVFICNATDKDLARFVDKDWRQVFIKQIIDPFTGHTLSNSLFERT